MYILPSVYAQENSTLCQYSGYQIFVILEYAGELHIIALRRKRPKWPYNTHHCPSHWGVTGLQMRKKLNYQGFFIC